MGGMCQNFDSLWSAHRLPTKIDSSLMVMGLMSTELRSRRMAVALAWLGALTPSPIPLSGLHKFYLGQPFWGVVYLLLGWTQIPRVACAVEGFWLLIQSPEGFASRWQASQGQSITETTAKFDPTLVTALGTALRELDTLRQEGLISELEFEQKRRQLLEKVG
jgi:TM2 domain-containing membrane protein YozV